MHIQIKNGIWGWNLGLGLGLGFGVGMRFGIWGFYRMGYGWQV